ncbi:ribonuclease H-like domain-containing protein [Trichoderma ceciliae]
MGRVAQRANEAPPTRKKGGRPTSRPPKLLRTRLERARDLADEIVRPREHFPLVYPTPRILLKKEPKKEKAREKHLKELDRIAREALVVYTDGSKSKDPETNVIATGWGFYLKHEGTEYVGCGGMGARAEVFDGEARGLERGLTKAVEIAKQNNIQKVVAYLDNQAVIHAERKERPSSSYEDFEAIQKLKRTVDIRVEVRWVQGHAGIPGNKEADKQANRGARIMTESIYPTAATMQRINRRDRKSGHRDFNKYYKRFNYNKESKCKYGEPKEAKHVLKCRNI